MPAPAKFTFDLDLGNTPERSTTLSERAVAALSQTASKQGFDEGFAQGAEGAAATAANAMAAAAEHLAEQAAGLVASAEATQSEQLKAAVDLAGSVARKLAAHLIARQPAAELNALIEECLAGLDHAPHLVVRCHPDLAGAIRASTEERMATSGFSGRLVIMGDPEIDLGDGRIEWVDGGLVRDLDAILAKVDTRIAAYLATHTTPNEETAS